METRSNSQKKNPIEAKDSFVRISAEEKNFADDAAMVLNEQKTEMDPISSDATLSEQETELDPITSDDDSSCGISSCIFGFAGFVVTGLVAILLYYYS